MSENTQRPPVGAAPYFIQAGIRIGELGEAISKYSTTEEIHKIREWASEIILQCDLIREMKFNIKEDCRKEFEKEQRLKRGEQSDG